MRELAPLRPETLASLCVAVPLLVFSAWLAADRVADEGGGEAVWLVVGVAIGAVVGLVALRIGLRAMGQANAPPPGRRVRESGYAVARGLVGRVGLAGPALLVLASDNDVTMGALGAMFALAGTVALHAVVQLRHGALLHDGARYYRA